MKRIVLPNEKLPVFEAVEVAKMNPPHKNIAVAMIAACIVHYWNLGREPKAIILNPAKYSLYKDFVRVVYGEVIADAEDFWWHGIQIRRERISEALMVELKPVIKN